jgi:hypothetical protein
METYMGLATDTNPGIILEGKKPGGDNTIHGVFALEIEDIDQKGECSVICEAIQTHRVGARKHNPTPDLTVLHVGNIEPVFQHVPHRTFHDKSPI